MLTPAVNSLEQNCRALRMCVKLCAGQSLSFAAHIERTEALLRKSYLQILNAIKKHAPHVDGATLRLNPTEKTSFVFCQLNKGREPESNDTLRFAIGTTEWGYQGRVEMNATGGVGEVSWQFYTPQPALSDNFGPYRYTSECLSTGAFCKKDTLGTGIVLLPFLLSQGIRNIAEQSPGQIGVKFLPSRFEDRRIFPEA